MSTLATRDELLNAYAAGMTSPGLSLFCATHLSLSPEARAHVAAVEEIGGAMLADESPAEDGPDLDAVLARLDEAPPAAARPTFDGGGFPSPLAHALDCNFGDIKWRKRLNGAADYTLQSFLPEKVRLLRARPGSKAPQHTHTGLEATLVLSGALEDEDHVLEAGDISLCGPEHEHTPRVIGDETCYCLVVLDGSLRFTGTWGPALNLFSD